jgi:hypothetical protein
MGSPFGNIEVRGERENNLMSYSGRPMVSRVSSLGLSPLRAWGPTLRMEQSGVQPDQQQAYQGANYGWQGSLRPWSRSWRG